MTLKRQIVVFSQFWGKWSSSFSTNAKTVYRWNKYTIHQAPVVQTMDSAIRLINHYPVDKS